MYTCIILYICTYLPKWVFLVSYVGTKLYLCSIHLSNIVFTYYNKQNLLRHFNCQKQMFIIKNTHCKNSSSGNFKLGRHMKRVIYDRYSHIHFVKAKVVYVDVDATLLPRDRFYTRHVFGDKVDREGKVQGFARES